MYKINNNENNSNKESYNEEIFKSSCSNNAMCYISWM